MLLQALLLGVAGAALGKLARSDDDSSSFESSEESEGNTTRAPARTARPEAVLDKFVETLISSEQYLKQIDTVEHKLNRLDARFTERSNSIMKYSAEILRNVRSRARAGAGVGAGYGGEPATEEALRRIRLELDALLRDLEERAGESAQHSLRAHTYPTYMDNKLETIEGSVKNVLAGVDAILASMADGKTRQYNRLITTKSDGDTRVIDATSLITEFRRTLQEQRYKKCDCKSGRRDRSERYPTDCQEIQMQGFNVTGIYKIRPEEMDSFYVLCDLTVAGGGWTVFQNRFDGSQDFFKSWYEYKHGFGNLAGEFWLGMDKLHYLTEQKLYELRVEVETPHGQEAFAGYSVFTVGPEHEGYRISTLGTYYGTAGDSLSYHAGQKFSTTDVDNDAWADGACTAEHGGAWWYKECDKSNLNGKYVLSGDERARAQAMYWVTFKGPNSPLARTRMMLRPLPASRPTDYENTRKFVDGQKVRALHPNKDKKPYAYEAHSEDFFSEFV